MGKLVKRFFSPQTTIWVISISLIVLFFDDLKALYDVFIVNNLLFRLKSTWYRDIVIILLAGIYLFYQVRIFKKHIPSYALSFLFFLVVLIYSWYRFLSIDYQFYLFQNYYLDKLYYSDIVFLLLFNPIKILLKLRKDKSEIAVSTFLNDDPIHIEKQDSLGYHKYAFDIANKILHSSFEKSFAIGINGKWGLGKTSFINLIKEKLADKDIIEINFNPWNSSNPPSIIKDFFETFKSELSHYHYAAAGTLQDYSKKIISLDDTLLTKSLQLTIENFTGSESLDSLHGNVESVIKEIDKKIIIYIDDLDRLDKDEIIEVIKLIRNTANFSNTFFIAAYDRDYIIQAVQELNEFRPDKYLEKIFQLEVNLPSFEFRLLREALCYKLCEFFPEEYHAEFKNELIGKPMADLSYLDKWLQSMRDVTRLYNSLILNLTRLLGEVEFGDLLRLELLRVNHPSIYELLYRKSDQFLRLTENEYKKNYYVLRRINEKGLSSGEFLIKNYLSAQKDQLFLSEDSIANIINLLEDIMDERHLKYYNKGMLSVIYPNNFFRYFAYSLHNRNLSSKEFNAEFSKSADEFKKAIERWVELGLEFELIARFKEVKGYKSLNEYKKVISSIFFLANCKSNYNTYHITNIVGYDSKDLIDKLLSSGGWLERRITQDHEELLEIQIFLRKHFENAKFPYAFEGDLIQEINSTFYTDDFQNEHILTRDEYKGIVLNYLMKHLESLDTFNSIIWTLFHYCEYKKFIPNVGGAWTTEKDHFDEAKSLFIDFVLHKDLDGFLKSTIVEGEDNNGYAISSSVLYVFEKWEYFAEAINKQSEEKWKYLREYKDFASSFIRNETKIYIPYDFKSIPIQSK